MLSNQLKKLIKSYPNFPEDGIIFRDFLPILSSPGMYSDLIETMGNDQIFYDCEAILAIDARGFLLGSSIALKLKKPMIVARKPGKLPGDLICQSYDLEYGSNSLSIQKDSLNKYEKFAIVDDLLATGGTVKCISNILKSAGKEISGLSVVIELVKLNGKATLDFPIRSQVQF
tara:strand:+ start:11650 stop:12168 length:519 start_codon:yes stop_codon:yes gene_type:complete